MHKTLFMGEPELATLHLSERERGILLRAARILAELRRRRKDDDDEATTDIALAYYVCLELAQDGEVRV